MMKRVVVAACLLGLGLAGCSFSEAQIRRERDQAQAECTSQSNTAVFGKPSPQTLCVRAALTRVRAANDVATCKAKGLQPDTPAMSQCTAQQDKARSDQVVSDYKGYAAQLGR
ncbi:hypothetical protein GCM10007874_57630 [Labrys miyagiensis]|uniref:Lipoprotein n=1 Tax=Labrys miyagiensis TaxID=346912 RepID=A0ABQ6CQY5_9HYPH|nr:hypothetical protein [Labrys miyagiensis]GLS22743.1 hypothetical protein GCM10007874_57630 [Labrys miyagiensis]